MQQYSRHHTTRREQKRKKRKEIKLKLCHEELGIQLTIHSMAKLKFRASVIPTTDLLLSQQRLNSLSLYTDREKVLWRWESELSICGATSLWSYFFIPNTHILPWSQVSWPQVWLLSDISRYMPKNRDFALILSGKRPFNTLSKMELSDIVIVTMDFYLHSTQEMLIWNSQCRIRLYCLKYVLLSYSSKEAPLNFLSRPQEVFVLSMQ